MLYFNYTEKLINLQGVIVKNIIKNSFSTTIFAEMPRKSHNCPCCNTPTDKIHDYRRLQIKDIPAFGKFTNIVIRKRRFVCPYGGLSGGSSRTADFLFGKFRVNILTFHAKRYILFDSARYMANDIAICTFCLW